MSLAPGFPQRPCFSPHSSQKIPLGASIRFPIVLPCSHTIRAGQFLPRSASVAGSGAEFPEQILETEGKKKKRNVAGVDQDTLVDPALLSDPDSVFYEFNGVKIHHKVHYPEEDHIDRSLNMKTLSLSSPSSIPKIGLPMILLHGFGASVFSWNRVLKPLATLIGSPALAFDRPAFGLTSRPRYDQLTSKKSDTMPFNPYSVAFSVLATLSFIEKLGSQKAILVGHSAGCLVAVDAYFESPEQVAALVLVAPAIFAPILRSKASEKRETETEIPERGSTENNLKNPFFTIWNILGKLLGFVAQVSMKIVQGIKDIVGALYRVILTVVLRSALGRFLIRMIIDKFGIAAIRSAWYNASKITDFTLRGYTKPLRAKDWDVSLLEYTLAMIRNTSKPPLSKRLAEISCPVLIITGDTDRIVPCWNAERLASAIPGSTFHVIQNCGHIPHEEKAEEFLEVVSKFLQKAFASSCLGQPEMDEMGYVRSD